MYIFYGKNINNNNNNNNKRTCAKEQSNTN